ncbi:MAG: hypothetical protein E7584_03145 [Ruminococcaceae bacterium]|nr:hypothetical protein [Oscillospiraceae bacterium]
MGDGCVALSLFALTATLGFFCVGCATFLGATVCTFGAMAGLGCAGFTDEGLFAFVFDACAGFVVFEDVA